MTLQKTLSVRLQYPTDLSKAQWHIIKPLIPRGKTVGHMRETDEYEVANAILYLLKTGCDWRMLPHDFTKWQTVFDYFTKWKKDGTWKKIHDCLKDQVRLKVGKRKKATAGVIDSQSVKTGKKGEFVAMMLVKK